MKTTWLTVEAKGRTLTIEVDDEKREELKMSDGCYAIKTDLPKEEINCSTVHDRYKDLAQVGSAFRACKTTLDLRPIYRRTVHAVMFWSPCWLT